MENFSTIQASNIAALAGLIVVIARLVFKINIDANDIVAVLGALLGVAAVITSYVSRYKKGDLTVLGARK